MTAWYSRFQRGMGVAATVPVRRVRRGMLTREEERALGLAQRDALVVQVAETVGAGLCLTLAGGYAADVTDTVDINAATVVLVARRWQARRRAE